MMKQAISAGATEIWVKDAHDTARNLIAARLPPQARLMRGWSGHPYQMVDGLDASFKALLMIGYHSRAGSDTNPLAHTLTCSALFRALQHHTPEIHHSDQGSQYAATDYTDTLRARGVQISMAEVGAAWQNGYAERLIRTIKEEEVDLSEYEDYHDAIQQIGRFLDDVYTHKRIHSALGYLTPAAFEAQWYEQSGAADVVFAT